MNESPAVDYNMMTPLLNRLTSLKKKVLKETSKKIILNCDLGHRYMYCAIICRSALLYIVGRKKDKPITSYNMLKKIQTIF